MELRMIDEAETLLLRASAMGAVGRYQLEAAIQSAHVARRRTGSADWTAVVRLYDALLAISGSPVAALNRALAIAELHGAAFALSELDKVARDSRLADYQPYWAARAELLSRIGADNDAQHAYDVAIGMERDESVRRFLEQRRALIRTA